MEITAPRGLPLASPPRAAATDAATALKFEALIIERLLTSARAAKLGDDGLGDDPGADHTRELTDRLRAQAIARAAPLGLAKVLAK